MLIVLPGFRLRIEYSINELLFFDVAATTYSESLELYKYTTVLMWVTGLIAFMIFPYKVDAHAPLLPA